MGASNFFHMAEGKTANEAFEAARDEALYDYGHAGYTGTIAEKHGFIIIKAPDGETPEEHAEKLMAEDDDRISDKWGPAGCIPCGENKFLFFGWAST